LNLFDRVYAIVRTVPYGKVVTYGQIALCLGNPKLSRQVGWALHANKTMIVVPCHRVVDRNGHLAGAFAFGDGVQAQLLTNEGIRVVNNHVDLSIYQHHFTSDTRIQRI